MKRDSDIPEQGAVDENVLTPLERVVFTSTEDRGSFACAKQLALNGTENAQCYCAYKVKEQHLRHYTKSHIALLKFLQRDENTFSREHLSDIFPAYYAMRYPERVEKRAAL